MLTAQRAGQARRRGDLPGLAGSLNNLSNRLADLGRREPALAAIEETVEIYRRLAEHEPAVFGDALTQTLGVERRLLREAGADPTARSPS